MRLRLAARALVEWKMPVPTKQYQLVLSELLINHPEVSSWGLNRFNKIFTIDERGIILWYLSETLNKERVTTSLKRNSIKEGISVNKNLTNECFSKLVEYGIHAQSNSAAWENGPSKALIADKILHTIIETGNHLQTHGLQAFYVMFLDEDNPARVNFIKQFWANSDHSASNKRVLQLIVLKAETFANALLVSLAIIGLITILALMVMAIWIGIGESLYLTIPFIIAVLFIILPSKPFFQNYVSSTFKHYLTDRATKRLESIQTMLESKDELFSTDLVTVCNLNPSFFATLIKENFPSYMSELVLDINQNITVEKARKMLGLITDPELSDIKRAKLFEWLCKVNIQTEV